MRPALKGSEQTTSHPGGAGVAKAHGNSRRSPAPWSEWSPPPREFWVAERVAARLREGCGVVFMLANVSSVSGEFPALCKLVVEFENMGLSLTAQA